MYRAEGEDYLNPGFKILLHLIFFKMFNFQNAELVSRQYTDVTVW